MIEQLVLKDVRTDSGTQQRPIDDDVVSRYMALMKEGLKFPPVAIVFDGKNNWLWDGFHRYHAFVKLNKKTIDANVEKGTQRDAMFFSFGANKDHGFPRQPGTVKAILLRKIFPDEEWGACTDQEIANWVGATRQYVSMMGKEYERLAVPQQEDTQQTKRQQYAIPDKTRLQGAGAAKNADFQPSGDTGQNNSPTETDAEPVKIVDSVGEVVPEHLVPIFTRVNEIKVLIHQLNKMLKTVKDARARNDLLFAYVRLNPLEVETANVKRNLKFSIPYAVCRYCGGDGENCRICEGLGFVNETRYLATIEELKK